MKTTDKKPKKLTADEWKAIAAALYHTTKYTLESLSKKIGPGLVGWFDNDGNHHDEPWQDMYIRALEKWPGVKIDREVVMALALPTKQREKAIAAIEKARAESKSATPTA